MVRGWWEQNTEILDLRSRMRAVRGGRTRMVPGTGCGAGARVWMRWLHLVTTVFA
jgi:hypothetical protein